MFKARITHGLVGLAAVALVVSASAPELTAGKPPVVTVSGIVIDLTCASKGKAFRGDWENINEDHVMSGGKIMKGCATMCLKGGQPAALFANNKIVATFACNPRATLSNYAADHVDVQGFWAGDGQKDTFIPQKIRKKGNPDWSNVNCATMHN